jgi:hypothetical protein
MRAGFAHLLLIVAVSAPVRAQDLAALSGNYDAVQRISEKALQAQGYGPDGRKTDPLLHVGEPKFLGFVGEPTTGTLTLAADGTFSMNLGVFIEGRYEILLDEQLKKPFLRFSSPNISFDANFQGERGLAPGELGIWSEEPDDWYLIQFRKTGRAGEVPLDPYAAGEAELASLFGQGEVKVDFAQVAKGSTTGVMVAQGRFTRGARFGSAARPNDSTELSSARVVLVFLPDGRFTVSNTISGAAQNGTYRIEGSELYLQPDGAAEEAWQIGRDQISGRFAIRPAGPNAFFFEVPLE